MTVTLFEHPVRRSWYLVYGHDGYITLCNLNATSETVAKPRANELLGKRTWRRHGTPFPESGLLRELKNNALFAWFCFAAEFEPERLPCPGKSLAVEVGGLSSGSPIPTETRATEGEGDGRSEGGRVGGHLTRQRKTS